MAGCADWTVEQVADWVAGLGFPEYRVSRSCCCLSLSIAVDLESLGASALDRGHMHDHHRMCTVTTKLFLTKSQEAFTANFINGAKLKHVNASSLPNMGITNFEHIKVGTLLSGLHRS